MTLMSQWQNIEIKCPNLRTIPCSPNEGYMYLYEIEKIFYRRTRETFLKNFIDYFRNNNAPNESKKEIRNCAQLYSEMNKFNSIKHFDYELISLICEFTSSKNKMDNTIKVDNLIESYCRLIGRMKAQNAKGLSI